MDRDLQKLHGLLQIANPHTVPTRDEDLSRLEVHMVDQMLEAGRLIYLLARFGARKYESTVRSLNEGLKMSIEISQLYPDDRMHLLFALSLHVTDKRLTMIGRMVDRELSAVSK